MIRPLASTDYLHTVHAVDSNHLHITRVTLDRIKVGAYLEKIKTSRGTLADDAADCRLQPATCKHSPSYGTIFT